MKKVASIILSAMMVVSLAACGAKDDPAQTPDNSNPSTETPAETPSGGEGKASGDLVIYCPHPLEFINPLVSEFENQSDVKVEVIAAGTGELLKRVESEAANPLGDIFW